MGQPSVLTAEEPWNAAAEGYAAEAVPRLASYSDDAIRASELSSEHSVIDVATGPGTLALKAALRCREVVAIDFSVRMVDELHMASALRGMSNLRALVGDGQALPCADASFDRAFSMFGLMFFEDRARGFGELLRVLRPGGRAAVSSWEPFDRVEFVSDVWAAVRSQMPNVPFGAKQAPLGTPEVLREEMGAAGFRNVSIQRLVHTWRYPSLALAWSAFVKMTPPLVMLRNKLSSEAWSKLETSVNEQLSRRLGAGPLAFEMAALLGLGTKN